MRAKLPADPQKPLNLVSESGIQRKLEIGGSCRGAGLPFTSPLNVVGSLWIYSLQLTAACWKGAWGQMNDRTIENQGEKVTSIEKTCAHSACPAVQAVHGKPL